MNLMMITLLTMGSAMGQVPAAPQNSAAVEEYYEDCYDDGHMGISSHLRNHRAIHNTAPQTCYAPRFGCYHSNERHMHRYPAFHGTFYRQSYNYRNYFDYPWHAQLHEPTSLFSYNVGEDQPEPPASKDVPPMPPQARTPRPAVRPQTAEPAKSSSAPVTVKPVTSPASTTPVSAPVTAKPAKSPVTAKLPKATTTGKSDVSQAAYMAPAAASRRLGSSDGSTTKTAATSEAVSSRRISSSSTARP